MTPFQALYGYAPPKWKDIITNPARVASVKDHLEQNQKVVQILKENLNTARNRLKWQADRHRTKWEFEVGDWVFVRLKPYKQLSLKQGGKNKLAHSFMVHIKSIRRLVVWHMHWNYQLQVTSTMFFMFHV